MFVWKMKKSVAWRLDIAAVMHMCTSTYITASGRHQRMSRFKVWKISKRALSLDAFRHSLSQRICFIKRTPQKSGYNRSLFFGKKQRVQHLYNSPITNGIRDATINETSETVNRAPAYTCYVCSFLTVLSTSNFKQLHDTLYNTRSQSTVPKTKWEMFHSN